MKIMVFAAYMAPHTGGYCKNIQELAKRLVAKGHEVTVVTCNTENVKPEETIDGVKIIRLPCFHLLNGQYPVPKFSGLLGAVFVKRDVVITQTRFFSTSLFGVFYAWLYRVPLIHVERGTVHTVMDNKTLSFLARVYDHTCGTLVVKYANRNVGVSNAACEFVQHIGGKRTQTIYNGIEVGE